MMAIGKYLRMAAALILCFCVPSFRCVAHAAQQYEPPPPNVLLIVMDDMRYDELWAMPFVSGTLAAQGIVFEQAVVSTPLCCPTRSSLLTGVYAKNHGVLHNDKPGGSAFAFAARDGDTIATTAMNAGVRTGLIGKYLNLFPMWADLNSGHEIPPGWSTFKAWGNNQNWFDWSWWVGSSTATARAAGTLTTVNQYAADAIADAAIEFCGGGGTWMLYLCPFAPHSPATPPVEGIGRFEPFATGGGWVKRGGANWGENVNDKPQWVRDAAEGWWNGDALLYSATQPFRQSHVTPDDLAADRLRCLWATDAQLERVYESLWNSGAIQNTWIIVISDNGFLLGEHRIFDKGAAYEEALRVPLILWHVNIEAASTETLVSADVDVPRTIAGMLGITLTAGDGVDLLQAVEGDGHDIQYIQAWPGNDDDAPGWAGLRTPTDKYVELDSGEREYYDLASDPFECVNAIDQPAHVERVAELAAELAARRGLSMRTTGLPDAIKNAAYSVTLYAWGGTGPYAWTLDSGTLPAGLTLGGGGVISGAPTTKGTKTFTLRVSDASVSPLHGGPQVVKRSMTMVVK